VLIGWIMDVNTMMCLPVGDSTMIWQLVVSDLMYYSRPATAVSLVSIMAGGAWWDSVLDGLCIRGGCLIKSECVVIFCSRYIMTQRACIISWPLRAAALQNAIDKFILYTVLH